MPGNVIIWHKCTKNYDYMVYCSCDMACDRSNCYFPFWVIFCAFTPLTCPKNENFKKIKIHPGDIIILHKCTKNHDHMVYCSWDMAHDRCNCYNPKTQNFKKKKKTPRNIIILHICTINDDQMMYGSWDLVHNGWMDGWTDGWADSTLNFQ